MALGRQGTAEYFVLKSFFGRTDLFPSRGHSQCEFVVQRPHFGQAERVVQQLGTHVPMLGGRSLRAEEHVSQPAPGGQVVVDAIKA